MRYIALAIALSLAVGACTPPEAATDTAEPAMDTTATTPAEPDASPTPDAVATEEPSATETPIAMASPESDDGTAAAVDSFQACVDAGYPVMESFPRQCRTPDGEVFTEDIGNVNEMSDEVQVDVPRPNDTVTSPMTVTGQARGPWFFEAQLDLRLEDADGNILAQSTGQAQGEWMTEDFVAFEGTLEFDPSDASGGRLIIAKANPSGLPENAAEVVVPVQFE